MASFIVRRYPADYSNENAWVLIALEEICNRLPMQPESREQDVQVVGDHFTRAWVEDQIEYHERKSRQNHRNSNIFEKTVAIVFFFAFAAAVLPFIISHLYSQIYSSATASFLTVAGLVLPALAATFEGIRYHRD